MGSGVREAEDEDYGKGEGLLSNGGFMNLVPLNDKLIVEPNEAKAISKGGIHLPENSKEAPLNGKVLAVGLGRYDNGNRVTIRVNVGEVVWYGRYAGTKIERDGQTYLVLSENDILAVER